MSDIDPLRTRSIISPDTRNNLVTLLLVLAALALMAGANHTRLYRRENARWLTAHGLMLGRPGPTSAMNDLGDEGRVIDEFSVERGPASLCRWTDSYADAVPSLARVRAIARAKRWRPGTRVRLKIDPADTTRCRPAYGWAEFVRLDLTGYVFLVLLFGLGALYVRLGPTD